MEFRFTKTWRQTSRWTPLQPLYFDPLIGSRQKLSSSPPHHLLHFSDLDCFSLGKSSLPIRGPGEAEWCVWCWLRQTAGFSHRVMKGVCVFVPVCELLCCLGVSHLLTLLVLSRTHSQFGSTARPHDLFMGAGDQLPRMLASAALG